jgi:hypothetical protein
MAVIQSCHQFDNGRCTVQQDTFGHFQLQQLRRNAGLFEHATNVVQKAVTDKLQGQTAGLPENSKAQGHDLPVFSASGTSFRQV